jgi:hypothetical protein
MSATNDDVRLAWSLIGEWDADDSGTYAVLAAKFAAALAAEREKARVQMLALADELSANDLDLPWLVLRRRGRPDPWVKAQAVAARLRVAVDAR